MKTGPALRDGTGLSVSDLKSAAVGIKTDEGMRVGDQTDRLVVVEQNAASVGDRVHEKSNVSQRKTLARGGKKTYNTMQRDKKE